MAACTATLNTVELLELILVNSHLATIFAATQVSRTWRSTVEQSHALRERLLTDQPIKGGEMVPMHHLRDYWNHEQGLDTPNSYLRTFAEGGELIISKVEDKVVFLFAAYFGTYVKFLDARHMEVAHEKEYPWVWHLSFYDDGMLWTKKDLTNSGSNVYIRKILQ